MLQLDWNDHRVNTKFYTLEPYEQVIQLTKSVSIQKYVPHFHLLTLT